MREALTEGTPLGIASKAGNSYAAHGCALDKGNIRLDQQGVILMQLSVESVCAHVSAQHSGSGKVKDSMMLVLAQCSF